MLACFDALCVRTFPRLLALPGMDNNHHAKSLKTLADNQRWLNEHHKKVLHQGDLPASEQPGEKSRESETRDQQQ